MWRRLITKGEDRSTCPVCLCLTEVSASSTVCAKCVHPGSWRGFPPLVGFRVVPQNIHVSLGRTRKLDEHDHVKDCAHVRVAVPSKGTHRGCC
jgi:hypothetical protein